MWVGAYCEGAFFEIRNAAREPLPRKARDDVGRAPVYEGCAEDVVKRDGVGNVVVAPNAVPMDEQ
jgi:hypothetical protein